MIETNTPSNKPWQIDLPLPIRTDRLVLRPCREGDGAALAEAMAESYEAILPWFHEGMREREDEISPAWQEVVACRHLAEFKSRERLRFLAWAEDETLVGSIELFDSDWQRRSFELAYWVRSSLAGRGYVTEGATAVLKYAFSVLDARRIIVGHAEPNAASENVIGKLGFRKLSSMPMGAKMTDGTFVSGISYVRTDASNLPDMQASWGQTG